MDDKLKQLIVLIEQKNDEKLSSVLKDLKSIKDNNSLVDTDILKTLNEILNVSKTINKDDIEEIRNEVKTISESINKKQDNPLMEDLITAIKNIKIEQPSEISIKGMGKLKGATGEKGDKGDNGYTPIKGVDYFDGEKGEKGKDGSPDTPEQIVEKINTLENVIELKTIKDFPVIENTSEIKRQVDTIGNQVLRLLSRPKTTGGGGGTWGSITGTLSDQTDLQNALNAKQNTITTGTTAQYFRGDLSLATFPTNVSTFTNDSGYITSSALTGYVPTTRTLTINGTAYDLSADRSWSVGTVTSVAALTLGTTGTDLSSSVATGTTTPVITLNVPTASATNRGALSSTDWSTFNAKESALTFSTGLTRTSNTITANLSTGVSGGQSVIGGTASGNNLTLSSTSNATKGKILFGNSAYNEVNDSLGIGTNAPSAKLEVRGGSDFWGLQVGNGTVGALFQVYGGNAGFVGFSGSAYNSLDIRSGISTQLFLATNGKVGIGTTTPTALLMLAAGTATASTAPLKFTSGTLNTTAEAGAIEYNNTFHVTNSDAIRRHIVTAPNTTKVTASAPYTNDGYITINIGGTDFKVMTTA